MQSVSRFLFILGAVGFAGAAASPSIAQVIPIERPTAQAAPTTQPASPATQPATQPSGPSEIRVPSSSRPATTQISMRFENASIDAVLEHLSREAGFIVLKDKPVEGRVTVTSVQPVSPSEAVSLLNSVLKTNNLTVIQQGRILKVSSLTDARKGSVPVRIITDPKDRDATDDLLT